MLRTRLWVGTLLIVLTLGVLILDQPPFYPFLFALILALTLLSCRELLNLLAPSRRPPAWFCFLSTGIIAASSWGAHLEATRVLSANPWAWILGAFVLVVWLGFLLALAGYRTPNAAIAGAAAGDSLIRLALTVFFCFYLGVLPCFLTQMRWPTAVRAGDANRQAVLALALTIFVPKFCDVGAFFTGRFLGRRPMTPTLSPKKTWEGLAGGLSLAMVVAFLLNRLGPVLPCDWTALGFGLTVGLAGVLGDLAESFIKRECQQKDASQMVPGFGGVLDVVDSILFAAPVAWCWLML